MTDDSVRELIEAVLADDREDPRLARAVEGLGARRTALVMAATFAYGVLKRFSKDQRLESVRDFVKHSRARLASTDGAPQLIAEGMIRSVLDEDELANGIPKELVMPTQTWLIHALAKDLYPNVADRQQFID